MKIAVLGYSGAGKSTLSRELGTIFSCPVLHLDTVQFEEKWKERDRDEAKQIVWNFMEEHKEDGWVIDGNYAGFYRERRLKEADCIVFLDFSRRCCLWQAFKRFLTYHGRTRQDMANGCMEKLDLEFIMWILKDGRTEKKKKEFQEIFKTYPEKCVILKTRQEKDKWLYKVREKGNV